MSAGRADTGAPAQVREADRRGEPRLALRLPLGFREVTARPPVLRRGQTLDVGRGGVRFRAEELVPAGAFLVLELELPQRGTHASRARAVWVREAPGGGHWEVGTEFVRRGGDVDAELAEVLLCGGLGGREKPFADAQGVCYSPRRAVRRATTTKERVDGEGKG